MSNQPLVSVIVPFYNEEDSIAEAVQSILSQTYSSIDVVLINDHSTDRSIDIVMAIDDSRLKIIEKKEQPQGRAASRNTGVDAAAGDLILLQDADDTSEPTRIEEQVSRLLEFQHDKVIVGCGVSYISDTGVFMKSLPVDHSNIIKGFERSFNRVTIAAGTLLLPKQALLEIPYRNQYKHMEDWDLLLRLYETGQYIFANVDKPLYNYNVVGGASKAESDWCLYNYYVRYNQQRRKSGDKEVTSVVQFKNIIENQFSESIKWQLFQSLIRIKLKLMG